MDPEPREKAEILSSLFKKLHLQDSDVLNVYCLGSRLWWPSLIDANSDYDYYIVVKGSNIKTNTHNNNVDAFIVSLDVYKQMLAEHHFLTVVTYFLDKSNPCHLLERSKPTFKFDQKKLGNSLKEELKRDEAVARKHLSKGNPVKALKIMNYCSVGMTAYMNLTIDKKLFGQRRFQKVDLNSLNDPSTAVAKAAIPKDGENNDADLEYVDLAGTSMLELEMNHLDKFFRQFEQYQKASTSRALPLSET